MKTSRRRCRSRVVDQPDDECHKCSTSRIHRLVAKKILPSVLRISGAAEEVEADPKSSSTAACWRRRSLSLLSRFQSYGTTRERRGREEGVYIGWGAATNPHASTPPSRRPALGFGQEGLGRHPAGPSSPFPTWRNGEALVGFKLARYPFVYI